jgi:hypothetical protein
MKKTIATVIASLFATAAFAQTAAPTAPKTSTPAARQAVLVNNSELKATKAETRTVSAAAPAGLADAKGTQDDVKAANTHAKDVKTSARHVKSKTKHVAKTGTVKDNQDTAAAPLATDATPAPAPADTPAPSASTTPAPDSTPAPATTPAPAAPVTQ